ncbi:MAG: Ig-like domain-containing protein [Pseudomonadota bacterium]
MPLHALIPAVMLLVAGAIAPSQAQAADCTVNVTFSALGEAQRVPLETCPGIGGFRTLATTFGDAVTSEGRYYLTAETYSGVQYTQLQLNNTVGPNGIIDTLSASYYNASFQVKTVDIKIQLPKRAPLITTLSTSYARENVQPNPITINGFFFSTTDNTVTFDGIAGTVTANSATSITVTPPIRAAGRVNAIVTNNTTGLSATTNFNYAGAPTVTASFDRSSVAATGTATLTIRVANPNSFAQFSSVAIASTSLNGLTATLASNNCGTVSLTGGNFVSSNGYLNSSAACEVKLTVRGAPGAYTFTTGAVSGTMGGTPFIGGAATSGTLTIQAIPPTAAVTALSPAAIRPGETSAVTVVLTNPNGATALTGVGLTLNLPSGVTLAAAANAGQCGGTVSGASGGGAITLSGGQIAGAATCTVDFTVTSNSAAVYSIPSGTPTSTESGIGVAGMAGTLTVANPAVLAVAMTHSGHARRGQTLAYTVTPTISSGPTSGTLTATFTEPAGATLQSGTSNGWTCTGASQSCTRAASLSVGVSSGFIANFAISSSANGPLVPAVKLSGGGAASDSNTATDTTYVTPTISGITGTLTATIRATPTNITIAGANFSGGSNGVTIGGNAAAIVSQSATEIVVTPPVSTVSGLMDLVVTNNDATGLTATQIKAYTYAAPPALSTVQAVASVSAVPGIAITPFTPVTASGGFGTLAFAVSPGLPAGLDLDTTNGQITGTPAAAAAPATYTVTVTDSAPGTAQTSSKSFALGVARNDQTIAFTSTAPAGVRLGDVYTATAAATSGLAVDVTVDASSSAICARSRGIVSFIAVGTCVLNADQAGNGSWNPAPRVQQSFAVAPAPLVALGSSASFSTSALAAEASGTVTISFTNTNPGASASFTATLTNSDPNILTRVAAAPGGTCTGYGANAPGATTVEFTNLTVPAGGCTITLAYRGATAGTGGFTLEAFTPAGYPSTAQTGSGSVLVTPTIASVSPGSGAATGGTAVIIDGAGFSATPGNNSVSFGGTPGVVTGGGSGTLFVTAPAGAGVVDVTVTTNGQASPASASARYTYVAAPIVADKASVAIAYDSSGTAIDLTASVTGVHSAIAIGTAPQHGTTSIAGDVVTYTPAAGYFGADSFTYTATGIGGISNVATVSLTVATPGAPVAADKNGIAIAYDSAGSAIDLTASVTGVHSAIAIATAPAHGTTSIAGDVVTYTPAAGYFGADSFTYTATGPGGTSAPATVALTVATPAAPVAADKSGVAVAYDSNGTAIDLTASVTGVHGSIAIAIAPAHGTASIAGDVVTYTPATGYYGADSFTYTATGPGGTSPAATVSIVVATPAAPIAADKDGVAVSYASSGTLIDLAAAISGVHGSIAIGTAPAHGTANVAGDVVTYTPTAGYFGADSFAYTATGPGGTSGAATVRLTVATPAAPVAADKAGVAIVFGSTGTAIDLTASVGGVRTSVAIATAPAHGTTSVAGEVVTYTPATGYFGADSFTYSATGPGGTSSVASVSLTVATPPAPMAADKTGIAVAYGSSGTAIDLSGSVSGVHASIAIGTAPAHGTAVIANDVVTYTPAASYAGDDSFTYAATGPGGTSAMATVSLTVGSPSVAITTATLAEGQKGVAYSATLAASGGTAPYGFRVSQGALPVGVTLTNAGVLAGLPTEFGSYAITISVTDGSTGAGPFSATHAYTLVIATPPAPTVTDVPATTVASSTVTNNQSTDIDLSAQVTGEYDEIRIDSPPAHGTVTVRRVTSQGALSVSTNAASRTGARYIATYTPATGYNGADSFTFVAVGAGGTSRPAAVNISVIGLKPVAPSLSATTIAGQPVTVDLTSTAREGPFTGAAIVSVSPAASATARLVEGGTAQARTYGLEIQTDGHFGGTVVVTYTLTNAFGTSDPATVTLGVTARPNPAADPTVRGLVTAQADAARRFGRTQTDNFQRRNEQLHSGGNGSTGKELGMTLTGGDRFVQQMPGSRIEIPEAMAVKMESAVANWGAERAAGAAVTASGDMRGGMVTPASMIGRRAMAGSAAGGNTAPGSRKNAAEDGDTGRKVGSGEIWTGGAIEIGARDATTNRRKLSATSSGLSAGLDVKLADGLILGAGSGYGGERTEIGEDQGRMDARSWVGVVYGSYRPAKDAFIDVIGGLGGLDFKTRRIAVNNQLALGNRDGTLKFGSISAGYDGSGALWRLSAYGRVDYVGATLGRYTETGAGLFNLRFDARSLDSLSSVLGARASLGVPASFGLITPRGRFEWRHEFQNSGAQLLDFADLIGSTYRIDGDGSMRDEFSLELGLGFELERSWRFGLDLGGRKSQGTKSGTLKASVSTQF